MSGFTNRPLVGQRILDNVAGQASGIISTRATAKYVSGARCILKVNGKISAFAFGISWRINTMQTEINTIDDYVPYELAPQRVTVEGTINALHIPGQSAGSELWQADILAFLKQKYISIEVRDVVTDDILFYTSKAAITSRAEDIKVDQLSNVTISFKAIGFRDEREPTPLKDKASSTTDSVRDFISKLPF